MDATIARNSIDSMGTGLGGMKDEGGEGGDG